METLLDSGRYLARETLLALQFPTPYSIVQCKDVFVSTILGSVPINIHFRRVLVGERWDRWLHLVRILLEVNLSDAPDTLDWKLSVSGVFSVKSMWSNP